MLSRPPGPSLTLKKMTLTNNRLVKQQIRTYRRVGLNSVVSPESQKFARLLFPPGFSRTRLLEQF